MPTPKSAETRLKEAPAARSASAPKTATAPKTAPRSDATSGTARYWLVKSEPFKYSYADLVRDGKTRWDGVRNFEARNALRAMKAGELALYYHSNEGREVVGIVRVVTEAYPDPTAPADEDWSVVDFAPVKQMKSPVSLDQIRGDPALVDIALLRRSRLSVVPVSGDHFMRILEMGKTTAPRAPAKAKAPARARAAKA